jgi:hypothetical protein
MTLWLRFRGVVAVQQVASRLAFHRSAARLLSTARSTVEDGSASTPCLMTLDEHFNPTDDHAALRSLLRTFVEREVRRTTARGWLCHSKQNAVFSLFQHLLFLRLGQ